MSSLNNLKITLPYDGKAYEPSDSPEYWGKSKDVVEYAIKHRPDAQVVQYVKRSLKELVKDQLS